VTSLDVVEACDRFNWQERQAKFIENSVRAYEFYGYGWWTPLWDRDLVKFWEMVPLDLRYKQAFYHADGDRRYSAAIGDSTIGHAPSPRHGGADYLRRSAKRLGVYPAAQDIARRARRHTEWDSNPLAIYGLLTKDEFSRHYDHRLIDGIAARLALGELSLESTASWRRRPFFDYASV
jgi:asparagine synthase (glutamine-hydrolysing)